MSTNATDDAPNSSGQKALASLPIVLTILATIFAGMSSSEMTRSMYFRSLAGQYQAKAGSQWGFFQAKKMRGATLEVANDLGLVSSVKSFDEGMVARLRQMSGASNGTGAALIKFLDSNDLAPAVKLLGGGDLPTVESEVTNDASINELLSAIRSRTPESKTTELASRVSQQSVDAAIETAESVADAFDRACQPAIQTIRSLDKALGEVGVRDAQLALRFAAQAFNARRYDQEAKFNQQIGELYEIQVRRAGFDSERHRIRSKNFFYAMLCAQAGVTIASLALAKSKQSAFWLMAGLAGLLAIGIAAYVYLMM